MTLNLDTLRKTAEAATPGPWHWAGNADNHQLYLATWIKGAGRCQVMDFERWGMQGAIPRFLDDESLMMQTAKNRLVFEVARNQGLPDGTPRSHPKVYRADVVDVMHPNAKFIATFDPATVLALLSRLEQAEQQVKAVLRLVDDWESGALRWEDPLRVPNEVFLLRKALQQPTHEPDWTDYQLGDPGASCSCGYNGPYKECWQSRRALDGDGRG